MKSIIKQIVVDYLTNVVVFDIEKLVNNDTKSGLVLKYLDSCGLTKYIRLEHSCSNSALNYSINDNKIHIKVNLDYSKLYGIKIVTSEEETSFNEIFNKLKENEENISDKLVMFSETTIDTFENIDKLTFWSTLIKNNVTSINNEWLEIDILY